MAHTLAIQKTIYGAYTNPSLWYFQQILHFTNKNSKGLRLTS